MKPFEKQPNHTRQRWVSVFFAFFVLTAFCVIFLFTSYSIEMELIGQPEFVLTYGTAFEDPGSTARVKGPGLPREGKLLPVKIRGTVDETSLGEYKIVYHARWGILHESISRQVSVQDRTPPTILLHDNPAGYVLPGAEYVEEGYLARDDHDGDLSGQVQIIRKPGRWIYTVTDSSGNQAQATRIIPTCDPVSPEVTLLGEAIVRLHPGTRFTEPGYSAWDNLDGDLTGRVTRSGNVDNNREGIYYLEYSVEDDWGNRTTVVRTVEVTGSVQPRTLIPEGKVIYLTFDDGPGPYTRQLLDILKKYQVKATFFVVKNRYSHLIKDIVEEGHAVGIHSLSHNYKKIYASEDAYFRDLQGVQALIEEISGVRTTLVRFPGGSSNTVSNFNKGIMTRLTQMLTEQGFQYFDWNVNSGDAGETSQADQVAQFVIEGIQRQDVSIVLQHDIKSYSVEAVEEIIIWGLSNGYRFLPLDPTSPTAHHKVRN